MTTLLKPDIRRTPREPGRRAARPLEMPVLFQLADLSPSQSKAPSLISAPLFGSPAPAPEPPPREPAEILFQPLPPEAPQVTETLPAAVTPAAPMEPASAEPAPGEPALASAALSASATESQEAAATPPAAPPEADSVVTVSGPSSETAAAAPTPRERAEQRAKNRQAAPAKSDWMRTHGKYIAVVFVIALIATIYAAQNGDEPAPARMEAGSTSEQAEAPAADEHLDFTHIHSASESTPAAESQRSPALAESSPAAEPGAHAELLPPAQGAAIKEPVPEDVAESKSLFPWKGGTETRVASKPDDGRKGAVETPPATAGAEETSPAASSEKSTGNAATDDAALAEEAPSIYGPPTGVQTEPAAEPSRGAPPAGDGPKLKAPTVYPVTNPSTYRAGESAARPAGGQQAVPASFEKSPTRTSGPRYERTGSGLY